MAIVHRVLSPGAAAMATSSGVPDYEWLTVDYPYEPDGLWTDEQVAQAARELAPTIARMLTDGSAAPTVGASHEPEPETVQQTEAAPPMSTAPFEAALAPMSDMLAADGYSLALSQPAGADARLTIEVVAGPDACEECLVPKDIFQAIATKYLNEKGLTPEVDIVYPAFSGEGH